MKMRYETGLTLVQASAERLVQIAADLEGKKEKKEGEVAEKVKFCEKLNCERRSLLEAGEDLDGCNKRLIIEMEKEVECVGKFKERKVKMESQLFSVKSELENVEHQLKLINGRGRMVIGNRKREIEDIERVLKGLEEREKMQLGNMSLFDSWKDLIRKCGVVDREIEIKRKEREKLRGLQRVFGEVVELVGERQEEVDGLKRTIEREKSFFRRRVSELML
jgi:hypothetical protein